MTKKAKNLDEMAQEQAQIKGAVDEFDWRAAKEAAERYAGMLRISTALPPATLEVIDVLQDNNQYDAVMDVADAALAIAPDDRTVWKHYAQALVDQGRTAPALRVYSRMADDPGASPYDHAEARGGVGRCYKQLFLTTGDPSRRVEYLRRALEAYGGLYFADRSRYWHGINVAALLSRAAQDDLSIPGIPDPRAVAAEVAAEVLSTVKRLKLQDRNSWATATACEAHVARGEVVEAVSRARKLVADKTTEAFVIGSLLRQFLEVWQMGPDKELGTKLLPLLRSALVKKKGGGVTLTSEDVSAGRLDSLEQIFGADRYQPLQWWRNGLARCRAVARVDDGSGYAHGTGFLLKGSDLHRSLPELVVVTNGHVVPDSVTEDNAVVTFHGLDNDEAVSRFNVRRQWWYSPPGHRTVDTAVLELDGTPKDVDPLPVATKWPKLNDRPRTYIIGHPGGNEQLQFSVQDNLLLDLDDTRLHYRSPTEPGSSGSPVFDGQWKVIGLHHSGKSTMPRLNNRGGAYEANEALRIDAIRRAMSADLLKQK
jgi:V8-like Glu-specific endopeptidase/tetratricopeptide (TPR) repeat protein